MVSLLSRTDPKGKRTFLQPTGKALTELAGMSKAKAIKQIKAHIIRGNINQRVLEKKKKATLLNDPFPELHIQ